MYNRKEIKVSPPAKNPGSPFGRDRIVANDGLFNPFVNKEVRVPSNQITTKGMPGNVLGIGSNGRQIMMVPGQEYNFGPDASYVDEIAMYQVGGATITPAEARRLRDEATLNWLNANPYTNNGKPIELNKLKYKDTTPGELPKMMNDNVFIPNFGTYKPGQYETVPMPEGYGGYPVYSVNGKYIVTEPDFNKEYFNYYMDPNLLRKDELFPVYGKGTPYLPAVQNDDLVNQKNGGQSPAYMDIEVDDITLQELRDGGFIVEELPKAQNGYAKSSVQLTPYYSFDQPESPEAWVKEIKNLERQIGNPFQWTKEDHSLMQNKLNDYKDWRAQHPEVRDSSNKPNEYVVPVPYHLKVDGSSIVEELPGMQTGGTKYTYGNANYMKQGNKWLKEVNGKYVPLTSGNVQERYAVLNKGAKPVYGKVDQEIGWQQAPSAAKPKPQTTEQKKAQQVFDKSFKVDPNKPGKYEIAEKAVQKYVDDRREDLLRSGVEMTPEAEEYNRNVAWSIQGVNSLPPARETVRSLDPNDPNHISLGAPTNPTFGDYAGRAWDVITNPLDAFTYSIKGDLSDMPYNYNAMEAAGIEDPTVSNNSVASALDFASYFTPLGMVAHGVKNVPHTASEINQAIQSGKSEDIWSAVGATGMNLLELAPGLGTAKQVVKAAPTVVSQLPQGLGNVAKGRAQVGDLFKRADLMVGTTPEKLAAYTERFNANSLNSTTGKFASQIDNPTAFNYLDELNPMAYIKPQTKASAESFRIKNQVDDITQKLSKNPNYKLTEQENAAWEAGKRSLFDPSEISRIGKEGVFNEYPKQIVRDLKKMSANPEGYFDEAYYKGNEALQAAAKDPRFASSYEFLLNKAPDPALFKSYNSTQQVKELLANPWVEQSALGAKALEESVQLGKKFKTPLERGAHAGMHSGSSEEEEPAKEPRVKRLTRGRFQDGGSTGYTDMELDEETIVKLKEEGFDVQDLYLPEVGKENKRFSLSPYGFADGFNEGDVNNAIFGVGLSARFDTPLKRLSAGLDMNMTNLTGFNKGKVLYNDFSINPPSINLRYTLPNKRR